MNLDLDDILGEAGDRRHRLSDFENIVRISADLLNIYEVEKGMNGD
jgi:hypothetical protein